MHGLATRLLHGRARHGYGSALQVRSVREPEHFGGNRELMQTCTARVADADFARDAVLLAT